MIQVVIFGGMGSSAAACADIVERGSSMRESSLCLRGISCGSPDFLSGVGQSW